MFMRYLLHPEQRPNERDEITAATQQKYINCFMRECVGWKAVRNASNVTAASGVFAVFVAPSDAEVSKPGL